MDKIRHIDSNRDEVTDVKIFVDRMFENFSAAQIQLFMSSFNDKIKEVYSQEKDV